MIRGLRVMFYDVSENRPVGWSWRIGAWLYKLFGRFDAVRGVRSWTEALAWLKSVSRGRQIDDLRFWGHGRWGRAYIGGAAITHRAVELESSPYHQLLCDLRPRFHERSVIWFRTCSTAGTEFGHRFLLAWSKFFGCRVAGQTFVIHYWHSGTGSVRPGERPDWPVSEGVVVKEGKRQPDRSCAVAPRTLRFWQSQLPTDW